MHKHFDVDVDHLFLFGASFRTSFAQNDFSLVEIKVFARFNEFRFEFHLFFNKNPAKVEV